MKKRILIIAEERTVYEKSLPLIEEDEEIYETREIQDAFSHISIFSYHLIVIGIHKELNIICELVETIYNMTITPIMVLLQGKMDERIQILKAGADVVLIDSYKPEEVQIQAYVLVRRYSVWDQKRIDSDTNEGIEIGLLKLNILTRTVFWNHIQIFIVRREFDFLYLLASTPGRVYTYNQIYRIVWKEYPHGDITNIIYCMVYRLKQKLKKVDIKAADIIYSVKEVGYRLNVYNES